MISCVKELTDQENTYNGQSDLYMTYMKTNKQEDLEKFDSFFVERDRNANSYFGDKSKPPYAQHQSILK